MIEASEQISRYINLFPDTRSTQETLKKSKIKGSDYLDYLIGDPIEIPKSDYDLLSNQILAYIRICDRIGIRYQSDPLVRVFFKTLILQHETQAVASMVDQYPIFSLSGSRVGTDTMIDQNGAFKTLEVNIGPVGGPPEGIKAEQFLDSYEFPVEPEDYINYYISSLDSYYQAFCEKIGKTPKKQEERQLAIIENDEWTPGNFILMEMLKEKGIKVEIVPKEALEYSEEHNNLTFTLSNCRQQVDQIIMFFHLQEDQKNGQPGDVLRAAINNAVAMETSMLPLFILASKATMALISQISDNSQSTIARRLELSPEDLSIVREMFPHTYHWRKEFFTEALGNGASAFNIVNYFKDQGYVIKSSRTNLFAGMGVYGADNKKGRKTYEDFMEQLAIDVPSVLAKKGKSLFKRIFGTNFINDVCKFTEVNDQDIIERLKQNINKLINSSPVNSEQDVISILDRVIVVIGEHEINLDMKNLLQYISTRILLPYVIQEKINPLIKNEYRTWAIVGNNCDAKTMTSTLVRPEQDQRLKSLRVVVPKS